MRDRLTASVRYALASVVLVAATLFAARIYDSQRGAPLELWHRFVPHEWKAEQLDQTDWAGYLAQEASLFDEVQHEVTERLPAEDRVPVNRYFAGSPVYPGRFPSNWNRSYILEPDGPPIGAAVFLHGLTDSPYSLRHIARRYRKLGYVAVAIRLPGHGTVPAALTEVDWQTWLAATRVAVREASRRIAPGAPLHLVGFSNGGALAMKYALDALGDAQLTRPSRVVLISPMIGLTRFARFAGLAGLPAMLPSFAEAAWLSVLPEFNPFKYNSFPVNAARQAHLLTQALQQRVADYAGDGRLAQLPPVLTFQSVMDYTVTTRAVLSALYDHLPANGSELVLFDLNRGAELSLLLSPEAETKLSRILPPPPRPYRLTVVTNARPDGSAMVEQTTQAAQTTELTRPLDIPYPSELYSLSHVALPFPPDDSLYGRRPDPHEDFGIHLGTLAPRGERGALVVGLDALLRATCNPFFDYMASRIEEGIPRPTPAAAVGP